MPDENKSNQTDESEESKAPEEVSSESKPASPEAEAVAANRPSSDEPSSAEATEVPSSDDAKKDEEAPVGEEPAEEAPAEEKPAEPEKEAESKPKEPSEEGEAEPKEPKEKEEVKPEEKPKEEAQEAKHAEKTEEKKEGKALAPKKIGKEKTKRKSNTKFLIIMGLSFIGLFVLFIVLMVVMIASGGAESPVLATLGLDAAGIKGFLMAVVNLSFGLLALIFFVIAVIGVFKMLFAKKADKDARGKGIKMSLIGILPLVFVMFIWLFLYNFIGSIEISAERVRAEILILEPTDLENLQAPLQVTFSSENVIKALQNQGFQLAGALWDFDGDGVFETEPTDFAMSYLYNFRGNYNVGLQVGVVGEEEPKTFFYPLVIGEAVFDAKPATGTAPLKVAFDASKLIPKGTKVQSLDWDFDGDGTYELTGKDNLRPRYTFEQIGTFNVHLRFVDQNNLVENYYREIEIVPGDRPLLSAEIEASPSLSGPIPLQVRFDGGKSESVKGSIIKYEWDFGDGSTLQVGRSVSHVYNDPGFYTVTLTIEEDSGKKATTTAEVEAKKISSEPEADIFTKPQADAEGLIKGTIPFKVSFDASGSIDPDEDIVDYEWDFGLDGATQTGQKVEFTFEQDGTYEVSLIVRDSEDQESTASVTVEVEEPGVRAVINADPEEGTVPLTIDFDGSASSAFEGKIVSYEWDFGDESPKSVTGARISHKYTEVGNYTVHLKVVTNENENAETEKLVYIREIPLRACFTPSRRSGEAPLAVTFDAKCSTGAVANFNWDFGDGETSDSRKPAHTFEDPGAYNVTLEVSDDKNNVSSFSDVIVAEGTVE